MTLTTIEKAAKLMGLKYEAIGGDVFVPETIPDLPDWRSLNPYTNKSDLSDVIDELGIDVEWSEAGEYVHAVKRTKHLEYVADKYEYFSSHNNNKFTARAHAVMSVVEQIYDARFGKDGE